MILRTTFKQWRELMRTRNFPSCSKTQRKRSSSSHGIFNCFYKTNGRFFSIMLVFVMNVHYLRTSGKNFIHLQRKICCQQNGLFVRSKSGRPVFSYFMARVHCCLQSITLLFMSYHKNKVEVYRAHGLFSYFRAINSLSPVAEGFTKIITKTVRPS